MLFRFTSVFMVLGLATPGPTFAADLNPNASAFGLFKSVCFEGKTEFGPAQASAIQWSNYPASLRALGEMNETKLLLKVTEGDERYIAITLGDAIRGPGHMETCSVAFKGTDDIAVLDSAAQYFDLPAHTFPINLKGVQVRSLSKGSELVNFGSDEKGWMVLRRFIPLDGATNPTPPMVPTVKS